MTCVAATGGLSGHKVTIYSLLFPVLFSPFRLFMKILFVIVKQAIKLVIKIKRYNI